MQVMLSFCESLSEWHGHVVSIWSLDGIVTFTMSWFGCESTASVVKQGLDLDQLRGKVATAATHEVRKHAAAAAEAVAAAREATMELDKVRNSV